MLTISGRPKDGWDVLRTRRRTHCFLHIKSRCRSLELYRLAVLTKITPRVIKVRLQRFELFQGIGSLLPLHHSGKAHLQEVDKGPHACRQVAPTGKDGEHVQGCRLICC